MDDTFEIEDGSTFFSEEEDLCDSILSRLSSSTQHDHQHLCTTIGAISQELKDHNLPLTPVAYFGAICSSLDLILSSSDPDSSAHSIASLTTLLSIAVTKLPLPIIKKKGHYLMDLVVRVIRLNSVTPVATASGLKILSRLLISTERVNWSDVSQMYGILLGFITDPRPKVRFCYHSLVCYVKTLRLQRMLIVFLTGEKAVTTVHPGNPSKFSRDSCIVTGE